MWTTEKKELESIFTATGHKLETEFNLLIFPIKKMALRYRFDHTTIQIISQ